jgi:hypothetical protein
MMHFNVTLYNIIITYCYLIIYYYVRYFPEIVSDTIKFYRRYISNRLKNVNDGTPCNHGCKPTLT